jgi:putative addiction module CopG family antidote
MLKANVKISGRLEEFTRSQIEENGLYETASEYLRDLIRQDMERREAKTWMSLREELMPGMKADRSAFVEVSAADVINRNKKL